MMNSIAIGTLIQWYEIEMVDEFIQSILAMTQATDKHVDITLDFKISRSEVLERCSTDAHELASRITNKITSIQFPSNVTKVISYLHTIVGMYTIADYRREFNDTYCKKVDVLVWGETDSLFPSTAINIISQVFTKAADHNVHKWILSFADRKMWDDSWKVIEHPRVENIPRWQNDSEEWLTDKRSSKCYMSIQEMEEFNSEEPIITTTEIPKFDGSCLVMSSDLVLSGVNIPRGLILCGEDTSIGTMAKLILGKNFIQFIVKNVIRVHNRRHPRKRLHVLNEDNPMGMNSKEKKPWFKDLEHKSKYNLESISSQLKPIK